MWNLDIDNIIEKLGGKIFVSEKDFQLELAYKIKEQYKDDVDVRLEYCPKNVKICMIDKNGETIIGKSMYIDILIIHKGKWYPIELKYKTREIKSKTNSTDYINNKDEIYEFTRNGFRIAIEIDSKIELTEELLVLFKIFSYLICDDVDIYNNLKDKYNLLYIPKGVS